MTQPPRNRHQQEHQANERTFLAWLRTAIALIGFGFAIARFGLFLRELQTAVTGQITPPHAFLNSQAIGLGLVVIGVLLIGISAWRYDRTFRQIEQEYYRPNRLMVLLTAGTVLLMGIASIPLILW